MSLEMLQAFFVSKLHVFALENLFQTQTKIFFADLAKQSKCYGFQMNLWDFFLFKSAKSSCDFRILLKRPN